MACSIKYESRKLGKTITFTADTKDELALKFMRHILQNEAEYHLPLVNRLLPELKSSDTNVVFDGKVDMPGFFNFFVNDYLNSMSLMNLFYGDSRMMHKDFVDATKRNGNLPSAGAETGSDVTNVAVIADPTIDFKVADETHPSRELLRNNNPEMDAAEIADGQSFVSVHWYMNKYLTSMAKWHKPVQAAYKKIRAGIPLTAKDERFVKQYHASLIDRKMIGKDLFFLVKTSTHTQTRAKTSYIDYKGRKPKEVHTTLLGLWDKYDAALTLLERQEILKDIHSYYKPVMGYEAHHDMLNDMERTDTHWVAMSSAAKTTRIDVGTYNKDARRYEMTPHQMSDTGIREQVQTDHLKDEIVHGTQLQGLVWSEQAEDDMPVTTPGGIKTTVHKLREAYVDILADRTIEGLGAKRKELFNEDGSINFRKIHEYIRKGLESSKPDVQLIKLLNVDERTGQPEFNWNLAVLHKKLQSLLLSYLSKDTLKHKVEGFKYTLVTSWGHNVIVDRNNNVVPKWKYLQNPSFYENPKNGYTTRELQFGQNENGVYVSEAIVPQRVMEKYGIKVGQEIKVNGKQLYQMGVRIPTQDKHSMVTIKIVDTLPSLYENSVIFPAEAVFLAGADFDIDALFARDYTSYTGESGVVTYGSYSTMDNPVEKAYEEWAASKAVQEEYKPQIQEALENDVELKELMQKQAAWDLGQLDEVEDTGSSLLNAFATMDAAAQDVTDDIKERKRAIRNEVLAQIMPFEEWNKSYSKQVLNNVKQYKAGNLGQIEPITREEADNLLLESEMALAFNEGNKNVATTTASLTAFKKALDKFKELGINIDEEIGGLYDALSKAMTQTSYDTGKKNIGPAALHNIIHQLLVKANATVVGEDKPGYFGKYKGYLSNRNAAGERINDLISTVITGMTDNAKHLIANKFNLSFDAVGPFMHMVSLGMPFDEALLAIRQPILTYLQRELDDKTRLLKRHGELESEALKVPSLDRIYASAAYKMFKDLFPEKIGEEKLFDTFMETAYKSAKEFEVGEASLAELIVQHQNGNITDLEDFFAKQMYILNQFKEVKEDSSYLQNLSSVIQLIKGFKTSFAEARVIERAMDRLGIEMVLAGEVEASRMKKDKIFEKDSDGSWTLKIKNPYGNTAQVFKLKAGWDEEVSNAKVVTKGYTVDSPIEFVEFEQDASDTRNAYVPRTEFNARNTDATIAIATDYSTRGEQLTAKAVKDAKRLYVKSPLTDFTVTDAKVSAVVAELNKLAEPGLFGKKEITLNLAGNGIYSIKGSQAQVDEYVYNLLKAVTESPELQVKVTSIQSGGQTGVDEAGVKAAARLGIQAKVVAPKGWAYRQIAGTDIRNEKSFKSRFGTVTEVENVAEVEDEVRPIQKAIYDVLRTNKALFARIATDQILKKDTAKFIIRQTPMYQELVRDIETQLSGFFLLNSDNESKLENALMAFINMRAYVNLTANVENKNMDRLNMLRLMSLFKQMDEDGSSIMTYVFNKLKNSKEELIRTNKFIRFVDTRDIELKHEQNPMANLIFGKILGNTRAEFSPEYRQDVANDLLALNRMGEAFPDIFDEKSTNIEKGLDELPQKLRNMNDRQLAKFAYQWTYYHALLVDNMQFRNNSLSKLIPAEAWRAFAQSLSVVEHFATGRPGKVVYRGKEFRVANFEDIFGMNQDEFVSEFMELYGRNIANYSDLRKVNTFAVNKALGDIVKVDATRQETFSTINSVELSTVGRELTPEDMGKMRAFGFPISRGNHFRYPQVATFTGYRSKRLMHATTVWANIDGVTYKFVREPVEGELTGDVIPTRIVRYEYKRATKESSGEVLANTAKVVKGFPIDAVHVVYTPTESIIPNGTAGFALPSTLAEYLAGYTRKLVKGPARGEIKAPEKEGAFASGLSQSSGFASEPVVSESAFSEQLKKKYKHVYAGGFLLFEDDITQTVKAREQVSGKVYQVVPKTVTFEGQKPKTMYALITLEPGVDDIIRQTEC